MFKDEIPKLRAIAEERHLDKIKMSHRLMDGDLLNNIKKCIKEDKIDFVIMGTAGATGWDTFFMGTNTGSVISGIDVPMFCIPQKPNSRKLKLSDSQLVLEPKTKALKWFSICKNVGAIVKCLYVKTGESDVTK
jgi:hypothetical protein